MYFSPILDRNIFQKLKIAPRDSPVVLLNGARQTGKTTLARALASRIEEMRYFTLDDAATLSAVSNDPAGFLQGLAGPVVIDEVQKAPGLFPAIKLAVDRDRRPGRFLLTGSADVLLLPTVSESLAGRMEILTLWPFSQGELAGREEDFIDALFEGETPAMGEIHAAADTLQRAFRGGFPEAQVRADAERRSTWFGSYITTILQRDVRDWANIQGLTELPRLLSFLATRIGALLNKAEISRATGIAYSTMERYLVLLETAFLVCPLTAWSGDLGKRLIRSPKLYLCDSGLAAHLLGLTPERIETDRTAAGPLLENFMVMELRKLASWARTPVTLHHLRTSAGSGVDVVLEDRRGRLVGIEVKASATLGKRDFRGLRALEQAIGERFLRGIVLYLGEQSVPFSETLAAQPVETLWQPRRDPQSRGGRRR